MIVGTVGSRFFSHTISFRKTDANKATRPMVEMQKAAAGAFAAFTIASSVLTMSPAANAVPAFPTQVLAEKVIREGVYGEYEIDLPEQKYDDARSTFKSAKETKTKKGTWIQK
jgi:hypothetical protein